MAENVDININVKSTGVETFNSKIGELDKKINDLKPSTAKLGSLLGGLFAGAGIAAVSFIQGIGSKIIDFLGEATKSAIETEARNKRLLLSVNENAEAYAELTDFAIGFSKISTFSKGQIKDAEIYAQNIGLTTLQTQKAINAAASLSKVQGVDLDTAMKTVSATFEGSIGRLGKLNSKFKELTQEQLINGEGVDLINKLYGKLATEGLDTVEGKLLKSEQSWKSFKTEVGQVFAVMISDALDFKKAATDSFSLFLDEKKFTKDLIDTKAYAKYIEFINADKETRKNIIKENLDLIDKYKNQLKDTSKLNDEQVKNLKNKYNLQIKIFEDLKIAQFQVQKDEKLIAQKKKEDEEKLLAFENQISDWKIGRLQVEETRLMQSADAFDKKKLEKVKERIKIETDEDKKAADIKKKAADELEKYIIQHEKNITILLNDEERDRLDDEKEKLNDKFNIKKTEIKVISELDLKASRERDLNIEYQKKKDLETYNGKKKELEKQREDLLISEAEYQDKLNALKLEKAQQISQQISSIIGQAQQISSNLYQVDLNQYTAIQDEKLKSLQAQKNQGLITEEQYNQQTLALQNDAALKEKELKKKYALLDLTMTIAKIAADTSSAIMATWKGYASFGPAGTGLAIAQTALLGGLAVAQTVLAKQQFDSVQALKDGGMVNGPGSSRSDSVPAMLSNGESVINARSTRRFQPILSAINQVGGGNSLGSTGQLIDYELLASLLNDKKVYVVSNEMSFQQYKDNKIVQKSIIR